MASRKFFAKFFDSKTHTENQVTEAEQDERQLYVSKSGRFKQQIFRRKEIQHDTFVPPNTESHSKYSRNENTNTK